jgi:hypothetical protein
MGHGVTIVVSPSESESATASAVGTMMKATNGIGVGKLTSRSTMLDSAGRQAGLDVTLPSIRPLGVLPYSRDHHKLL